MDTTTAEDPVFLDSYPNCRKGIHPQNIKDQLTSVLPIRVGIKINSHEDGWGILLPFVAHPNPGATDCVDFVWVTEIPELTNKISPNKNISCRRPYGQELPQFGCTIVSYFN